VDRPLLNHAASKFTQMPSQTGSRLRRVAFVLALGVVCLAAVIAVVAGGSDDGDDAPPPPDYEQAFADAPPELAALNERANELIDGGAEAFETQLEDLRGYPVVVNKWASWCGPCRAEFPYFQQAAAEHGARVAFLGVDGMDSEDAARTFLEQYPVPYPSFSDPDEEIIEDVLDATVGYPSTVFFDAAGEPTYTRIGPYESAADLEADINRYAR
jgi:cytochrome c biogenesis protein CcmG, thiol:disulfide interchange protein DsbE